MTGPAGIKAVAERAQVSVGTVSNVLNRPNQVADPTRARVEAAMRDLGFVRNSSAGSLRAGRSHALGLVVLDIGNPFFTDVARGVEQAAAEQGYAVLLCNSDGSPVRQATHLRFLEEHRVDGVLLTPVDDDLDRVRELEDRGTAVVLVDEPGQSDRCSVAVDDVRGGRLVGQHLLAQGRGRVAYVTGPDSIRQCADRGRGLEDSGLRVQRVLVDALTGQAGYEAAHRLPDIDAVFCANDVLALGVLRALLEQGVRVPSEVALVGYDDIEFAATAAVPLTSVSQPAIQLGRTAAGLLLDQLTTPDEHAHRQALFMPELIVRESSARS